MTTLAWAGSVSGIRRAVAYHPAVTPSSPGANAPDPGPDPDPEEARLTVECVSAVTLATHDMARAVRFYRALGFELRYGGETESFTSFALDRGYLNLTAQPAERRWTWWGRIVFYVSDVDALHRRALAAGIEPDTAPHDAGWGERYFHLTDPDDHELSFARPLDSAR